MPSKLFKWLRVVVALIVLAALTVAFIDFRGLIPGQIGRWPAEIQFIPSLVAFLTGASLSFAFLVSALITLAIGRVYCSAVCPLGIFQDVVLRLSHWLKLRHARFTPPHVWIRLFFFWGAVLAIVGGLGGLVLSLLDPYSNFGRIASDLFRPLAARANNALVDPAQHLGWHGLFRVEVPWSSFAVLAGSLLMLLLVTALAVWRGRLYCNTVCPVGTLLGWLSQRAAFQLRIDKNNCRKCAQCLPACKSNCIDLRAGSIDFSRCVACYDCLSACDQNAIQYRFNWVRTAPPPDSLTIPAADVVDSDRRAFLSKTVLGIAATAGISRGLLAGQNPGDAAKNAVNFSRAVCPPGSLSVEKFLAACTACHLCISECPSGVLQPAFLEYGLGGLMKPRMDYAANFCNFDCRRCGEVCPDGAIGLLDLAAKHAAKIGEAHFDKTKCVVITNGTDCAACSEHCPTKAVSTIPYGNNLRLPSMNGELCVGCGACEYACPARPDKAIKVAGFSRHGWAKKFIQPKASLPRSSGDFPF